MGFTACTRRDAFARKTEDGSPPLYRFACRHGRKHLHSRALKFIIARDSVISSGLGPMLSEPWSRPKC
jgi:hypothetical protein